MLRVLPAALLGAGVVALGGCGGEPAAERAGGALSYLPTRGVAIATLPTDFRSSQYRTFDRRVVKPLLGGRTERLIKEFAFDDDYGLKGSYARDVRPQLGSDVVVAVRSNLDSFAIVVAFQAKNGAAARRFIERQGLRKDGVASGARLYSDKHSREAWLALEGNVVIASDSERRLRSALARHDNGNGLTEAGLARRLGDLPQGALFRVFGDIRPLLEQRELKRYTRLPWVRGFRSFAATLGVAGRRLQLDGALKTDPAKMTNAHLPIAPSDDPPALVRRRGWLSGASQNQSRTTTFLLHGARVGFPRSRFVRDVARLERALDIDFEKDVLEQFNGPSASLLAPNGSFAARSAVKDPRALSVTMRRLAPDLGRLVEDLQRLDSAGLGLLLLFAPDAPVSPSVLGKSPVKVTHLRGQRDFYRASDGRRLGMNDFYFGLEKGVFVIGSSERRAKAMATAPASKPADLRGASVTDTDLAPLRRRIRRAIDADPGRLGRMSGSLSATRARTRGSLSIDLR